MYLFEENRSNTIYFLKIMDGPNIRKIFDIWYIRMIFHYQKYRWKYESNSRMSSSILDIFFRVSNLYQDILHKFYKICVFIHVLAELRGTARHDLKLNMKCNISLALSRREFRNFQKLVFEYLCLHYIKEQSYEFLLFRWDMNSKWW